MAKSRFLFLDGNPPWLDFVNTTLVEHGAPADRLTQFSDLIDWLREARLIHPEDARRTRVDWNEREEGRDALRRARAFRGVLRRAAERLSGGEPFPLQVVRAVNLLLMPATGYQELIADGGRFELRFHPTPVKARDRLAPLARSLGEFLERKDLGRVRKCGNPKCVLFFYDDTKNRGRRWCSMAVCGNRMKAAAHYRRRKHEAP